jgi:hypothetical protein
MATDRINAREDERQSIEMALRLAKIEAVYDGKHELAAGFNAAIRVVEQRKGWFDDEDTGKGAQATR